MIVIARRGTTITHEIIGQCGSAIVLLKPASKGTRGHLLQVRRAFVMAPVFQYFNQVSPFHNPINVVKATFDGLSV